MENAQAPRRPVGDLELLGIDKPGTYNMPCFLHDGSNKPQLSITVNYLENVKQIPINLQGVYNCFSCGSTGSIRNFKMWPSKGVTTANFKPGQFVITPASPIPNQCAEIYSKVWNIYRANYPKSLGEAYMHKVRGFPLNSTSLARITGFVPAGSKQLVQSNINIKALQALSLIDDKGRDKFSDWGGRIVMPLTWNGKITGFYGRSISADTKLKHRYSKASTEHHKWRRGAFGEKALDKRKVVITEAVLDALALKVMGVQNVCALGGVFNTEAINRLHPQALVVVALDNDETGNKVSEKLLEQLGTRALRATPPLLPDKSEVKDWSEYLRKLTQDFPEHKPQIDGALKTFLLPTHETSF